MDVIYRLPKENGGASTEGCVRYDQEQELTDEQKQQARENIGASGGLLFELEGHELEDMTIEEFCSIYGSLSVGCEAYVLAGNSTYKLLTENLVTYRNYDDWFLYFLETDGTIEEICLHVYPITPELEFRKLGGTSVYEVSSLEEISAETAKLMYEDFNSGKAVFVKMRGMISNSICYSVVGTMSDNSKQYCTLIGNNCLYKLSFLKVSPIGQLAELTVHTIPEKSVLYTSQTLTEEQQAQARENIGAVGGRLFVLEGHTLEDMTAEEFLSIYGFSRLGCEALVSAGNSIYKALAGKMVMTRNYDDLFLYFLNSDGTIEEICLHNHYNPEIEFRKLGAAENHQLLKSALSEAMGCSADTWHTLAEVTVPEDGVYQVSASVRAQPYSESTYSAVTACIEIYDTDSGATELQEIQLPRSGEYGTMSVPVEVQSGKTIRLRAYSAVNFYAQAAPSAGKASATFIAAVRIGAIYQE